ncbi:MAG: hypothetical protein HRT35_17695 [Algicola sp.]|nr:hypothetical protein [Algicola sp.]
MAFFKINVKNVPDSANVYDSLAEAYLAAKNDKLALLNYQKVLALDEHNSHAKEAIEKLKPTLGQAPSQRTAGTTEN